MNKRHFSKLLLSAPLVLFKTVRAQTLGSIPTQELKPYLQVKTVLGEENTVRVFFSPNCSFSKTYFGFFKNLANTLPPTKTFAFSPAINKMDGPAYALAYLAVLRFYPKYIGNFVQASFEGAQERMISTKAWAGIDKIAKASGIPVPISKIVAANKEILINDANTILKLQTAYQITNTPSVVVAGTYIVTPEFTSGDMSQFNQLVNGVISMTSPA